MSRVKEESDYRKNPRLSYSALKIYASNRIKFRDKYILGLPEEEKRDTYIMGNIVDVIMTDNGNFDNYFVIAKAEKPVGQLLRFTELLLDSRKNAISHSEWISNAYSALAIENGGKVRDKKETFELNFNNKAKEYFDEAALCEGKTIITKDEEQLAREIVAKIMNCAAFTAKGTEKLTKFPIFFEYNNVAFKMEADEMDIDHDKKVIYPYDYKITAFLETFTYDGFLKMMYYIQSSLYRFGIQVWAKDKYPGYKVENMAFKVADVNNILDPLLYQTSDEHYNQGFSGFYAGNKYYKGIDQLLTEIQLSTEMNNFSISITNYNQGGIVYIPQFKTERE